jgi:ribosomal-protein-alanine N-acetyltransferase
MEYKLQDITLRPVTHDDLAEVARMWNFEEGEISLEAAEKAVIWMQNNHAQNRAGKILHMCLGVFDNRTGRIIGWCGLDGRSGTAIHIFYQIDKDYRGKGYATDCTRKLLEWGFSVMQVDRIDGACARDNIASKRVLEKVGMRPAPDDGDSWWFYMMRQDYEANAAGR